MSLHDMRKEYGKLSLEESQVAADAIEQFRRWFDEALKAREAGGFEPNAMTLATCSTDGVPSARVMLLKDFGPRGFSFFTNYESRKGRELKTNPRAALVFFWVPLERQVRVEGTISRLSREESQTYFRARPRDSQLGAVLSQQSAVVADRAALERAMAQLEQEYEDREVPLPEHWGGYLLTPSVVEFWQGRAGRLHDRLRYTRRDETWLIERLSP